MNWQRLTPVSAISPNPWAIGSKGLPVEKTRGLITFPAFSLPVPNYSFPFLCAQYNCTASEAFVFDSYPYVRLSDDYMICLVWRSDDNWKVRYQLWDDPTYGFRVYQKDLIHRYFSLEFWCKNITALNFSGLVMGTSFRAENDTIAEFFDVLTPGSLVAAEFWFTLPFDTPLAMNPLTYWTKNVGTWNELYASSEKSASEVLPAGHS